MPGGRAFEQACPVQESAILDGSLVLTSLPFHCVGTWGKRYYDMVLYSIGSVGKVRTQDPKVFLKSPLRDAAESFSIFIHDKRRFVGMLGISGVRFLDSTVRRGGAYCGSRSG